VVAVVLDDVMERGAGEPLGMSLDAVMRDPGTENVCDELLSEETLIARDPVWTICCPTWSLHLVETSVPDVVLGVDSLMSLRDQCPGYATTRRR
jgi:hypothetical protein